MKLHLPLALRSALLAVCALVGLSSHSHAADSSPARYWVDADGVRHELEFDNEYLDINGATSFTLQDYVRVEDEYCWGGALLLNEGQSIIQADTVNIVGNKAIAKGPNSEVTYSEGGAIESNGNLIFTNSKQINITGNAAIIQCSVDEDDPLLPMGGAINMNDGMLEFKGNDKVVIRGNYVAVNNIVDLCAIDTSGQNAHVAFEMRAGQEVICYDGISVDGILFINTNTLDTGKWDKDYTGTITFTGEDTEELLKTIKGEAPTKLEIENSRTITASEIYVHAGTLVLNQVKMAATMDIDFYDYHIDGLLNYGQFYSTEEAEVQMINSTVETCWYRWGGKDGENLFEQYAGIYMGKASFRGHNTLKANYIVIGDTWTFHVQTENAKQAVLSIEFDNSHLVSQDSPFISSEGNTTFKISVAKGLAKGEYKLLEFDSKLGEWIGREDVTLSGAAEGKITANKGDVYYTIGSDDMLTLWFDYSGGAAEEEPGIEEPGETEKPAAPSTPAPKPTSKLTWTADSGRWSTDEGAWSNGLTFHTGDGVVFDRACEVEVRHTVRPGSIEVTNEDGVVALKKGKNGQISGATSLVKTGAGELSIAFANAYTGGTVIKNGTVRLGHASALGLGDVEMTGGTLDMGGKAVGNDVHASGEVSILRGLSYAGDMTLSNATLSGSAIGIAAGKMLAVTHTTLEKSKITLHAGAAMKADSLTLGSGSSLTLGGAVVKGNITVAGGTLSITAEVNPMARSAAAQTIDGDLALNSGTLSLNGLLNVTGTLSSTDKVKVELQEALLKQIGANSYVELISADSTLGISEGNFTLNQLKNSRGYNVNTDGAVSVTLHNEDLTWTASAGEWKANAPDNEWEADGLEDKSFHDYDRVTFDDAGEVKVSGEVTPGEIRVQGNGDTTLSGDAGAGISGAATLTKEGVGTLTIDLDNSKYTGDIIVTEGTLRVAHDNALGSGSAVRIEDATFDGGSHAIEREVSLSGTSFIKGANGVKKLRFESGSSITGESAYKLQAGHTLAVGSNVSYDGKFIFQGGGMLTLGEGAFDLRGANVSFESNPLADVIGDNNVNLDDAWDNVPDYLKGSLQGLKNRLESVKNLLENKGNTGLDVTVIDLRGRTDLAYGGVYTLLMLDKVEGSLSAEEIADKFVVYMDEMAMAFYQDLTFENGELKLRINITDLDPKITGSLSRNQRAVYNTLRVMSTLVEADGELETMRKEVFRSGVSVEEAKAALDALSGAELATIMTNQIEGNLAHLRRLRANMGSGQRADKEGKNTFYVVGYDDMSRVDANEDGPGMKRTEWGGMLGFERCIRESSLFGIAITSGSATVKPTLGEEYDDDSLRVDFYAVGNMGKGWQALMSVGAGKHSYSTTRYLGNNTATADIEGFSINFQNEISYTKQFNERHALQPFVSFEVTADVINSFTETGAGSASLESKDSASTAVDITLGARYIHSFQAGGRTGNVSLQAAVIVRKGEPDAAMDMHFTGVEHRQFEVGAASIDSIGYSLGAGLLLPVSKYAAFSASANAVMRSGAKEMGASVGIRLTF